MPVDKLNEKEIKALKRLAMTENKKKNTPAGRIDDLNKLMNEKANREGNPNTEPNQESLMQGLNIDRADFFGKMLNKFMQTPQYNQGNQGNQGNNNNMTIKDMLALMEFASKNQNNNNSGGIEKNMVEMLKVIKSGDDDKFRLMMENQNMRLNMIMQQNNGQTQQNPRDNLRQDLQFFRELQGDKHQKTKDEMVYALEKDKLVLQENSRQDMLNREERQIVRDDKKSERILDISGVVLDKIVGSSVGNLINDVMSAGSKKGQRRGRVEQPQSKVYDPSLLDEELE